VQFTKAFTSDQYARALESWTWVDLAGKTPMFTSLFGDVFLSSPSGWWYLDTLEGSLDLVWDSEAAMTAALAEDAGQDRYLLGALAVEAARRGLVLADDEVYALVPPPVLGGGFGVDSIAVYHFEVAVNLAGQVHEQVRHLPPGTRITSVSRADPASPQTP
jgi:hypothetical protein